MNNQIICPHCDVVQILPNKRRENTGVTLKSSLFVESLKLGKELIPVKNKTITCLHCGENWILKEEGSHANTFHHKTSYANLLTFFIESDEIEKAKLTYASQHYKSISEVTEEELNLEYWLFIEEFSNGKLRFYNGTPKMRSPKVSYKGFGIIVGVIILIIMLVYYLP